MIRFIQLSSTKRQEIFDKKKSCEIEVDRIILGFETIERDLPTIDFNQPFEVPHIIRDKDHLMEILGRAKSTHKGRWERTLAITYFLGGKVIYTKLDKDIFKAAITF